MLLLMHEGIHTTRVYSVQVKSNKKNKKYEEKKQRLEIGIQCYAIHIYPTF